MVLFLDKVLQGYDKLFNVWSDPRTAKWPMMGSPFLITGILIFYLYFVNTLGPKIMENRKPIQMKLLMIIYNIGQIIACSYCFVNSFVLGWGGRYKLICEPVDFSNSEHAISVAGLCYFYYIIKLVDLLDTVFFVLRKKQGHVSFLHVYHHTGMVMLTWSCVKFLPGGHATSLGPINSFVHVVMYGYYLVTLIAPKYKKSIWWKKHITQLQILQFLLLVLHFLTLLLAPNCEYPTWVAGIVIPQNLFMLILFLDFYIKAYIKKPNNTDANKNGVEVKHKNGVNLQRASVQENGTKAAGKSE